MTKSVQTKLVLILVLLTVATMLIVGAVMVNRVSVFYDNDFEKQITSFFDDSIINELSAAAAQKDGPKQIYRILEAYSGKLGIDSYRNFYV
ncbi:MAG: diguanylate cyclase, partial [Angelakisella sp.]